jgi:hypothetical protein
MKRIPIAVLAAFICIAPVFNSCKSKKEKTQVEEPKTTVDNPPVQPVTNATDEELNRGVTDAIKDHPSVHYSLNNGKIVLTGEIAKDKWVALKQTLDKLTSKGYDLTGLTIK